MNIIHEIIQISRSCRSNSTFLAKRNDEREREGQLLIWLDCQPTSIDPFNVLTTESISNSRFSQVACQVPSNDHNLPIHTRMNFNHSMWLYHTDVVSLSRLTNTKNHFLQKQNYRKTGLYFSFDTIQFCILSIFSPLFLLIIFASKDIPPYFRSSHPLLQQISVWIHTEVNFNKFGKTNTNTMTKHKRNDKTQKEWQWVEWFHL